MQPFNVMSVFDIKSSSVIIILSVIKPFEKYIGFALSILTTSCVLAPDIICDESANVSFTNDPSSSSVVIVTVSLIVDAAVIPSNVFFVDENFERIVFPSRRDMDAPLSSDFI